jgi:peptidoglycan/LPS O-acetylase OafA/YrhL
MPRVDSLTGLRWWAAFAVFAFHMKNLAPLPVERMLELGNYGVAFFFILSGFVLAWSAAPGVGALTFYGRRFARIYPAYLAALLLAIPVFVTITDDPTRPWAHATGVGVLLLGVLLLQGWSREPAVLFSGNPVAWTLSVEAFFYATFPFAARAVFAVRARGALLVAAGTVAVLVAVRIATVTAPDSWIAQAPWPLLRLPEFILGMALAWAMRAGWRPRTPRVVLLAALASAALFWYVAPGIAAFDAVRPFVTEVIVVLFALLIAAYARSDAEGLRSMQRHPLMVGLGEVSYAFYLVHSTVVYGVLIVVGVRPPSWSNAAWYAGVLLLSLALAWALHRWVERPLERRIRTRLDARARQRAAPDPQGTGEPDAGRELEESGSRRA